MLEEEEFRVFEGLGFFRFVSSLVEVQKFHAGLPGSCGLTNSGPALKHKLEKNVHPKAWSD